MNYIATDDKIVFGMFLRSKKIMKNFNIILFDEFETLDAFGPAEVIGNLPDEYLLNCYSLKGGIVASSQRVSADTLPFSGIDTSGVLLIPGGFGVRALVNDKEYIEQLRLLAEKAPYVLTVCTGSALLAKTGLLNGRNATTNKTVFDWACSNGPEVCWVKRARWVKDGKFYTSSGVSAGLDMIFGFISDKHGADIADALANEIEYVRNPDYF